MGVIPAATLALQVGSQLYGAFEERNALKRQARAHDENARLAELEGALSATQSLRQGRMETGEALAEAGASGVALGGSVEDVIIAQSVENQMKAMQERYTAAGEAAQERQAAAEARKGAKTAMISGFLGAATTALQGVSQMRADKRAAVMAETQRSQLPRRMGGVVTTAPTRPRQSSTSSVSLSRIGPRD